MAENTTNIKSMFDVKIEEEEFLIPLEPPKAIFQEKKVPINRSLEICNDLPPEKISPEMVFLAGDIIKSKSVVK